MSRKINLRLLASTEMSDKREHDVIRFPKKARERFDFANSIVVLGKGEFQIALSISKAYKKDIQRVAKLISQGKLSEREAASVGFVTRSTQQRLNRRQGGDIWISDGVESITIGADPEFGLIEGEYLVRGSKVIPKAGHFGSDGPGVEVRPDPSQNHLQVVSNICDILEHPPAATEMYRWQGGATYTDPNRTYWFGGHIHLGRPLQLRPDQAMICYPKLAQILDGLLAFPLVRFDSPNPHYRRNGCSYGYGKAGQIRTNENKFEYRVLSGLWLVHPTLATTILGAAKAITETAYNRIINSKNDMEWVNAPPSRKSLVKSFKIKGINEITSIINQARPSRVTDDHVKAWESWIRDLDKFDEYSAELKALIELVKTAPQGISLDLRESWQEERPLILKGTNKLKAAIEAVEAKR